MHAFGGAEKAPSLFTAVKVLQTAVTGERSDQEADAACIAAEIQCNVDASEEESTRQRVTITATHAEGERRVAAICEAGRPQLEELQSKLEESQHQLAVVDYPTRLLPHELMAEVLDWHMLMGGRLATTLLVCKWWTMVAYSSPRLWARITVTDHPGGSRYLPGSVLCTDLDQLRLVLSRSRSYPLQIALSFLSDPSRRGNDSSSASLMRGPQATSNRTKAVKIALDDQILRRCTRIILANDFLPCDHQNTTILPLLYSVQTYFVRMNDRELLLVQSLVNLSPALRHLRIRSHRSVSPEDRGVGLWTKRIESYVCISPSAPCYSLHESPSLRRLAACRGLSVPLTLPALQVLKWSILVYSALHRITAPHLHTLILRHRQLKRHSARSISFPNLRVAIHSWICDPTVLYMFHTPILEHLSIEYRSSALPPTAILELFDGWADMPTPKSLHLGCTFTDDALIAVLGRLPWLDELQIAGTNVTDTFWEGLTPSCNPKCQMPLTESYADECAADILVPNLKVLLVNHPTDMLRVPSNWRDEMPQQSEDPDDASRYGDWTVIRASTMAVAREQAGYPLKTLACWSLEQKVEVLIGSLDSLPNRPKFVSLTDLRLRCSNVYQ